MLICFYYIIPFLFADAPIKNPNINAAAITSKIIKSFNIFLNIINSTFFF